ncbi:MAG: MG2 domain-containing protein [Elusimicrobia bacterium]|nr:MG2 domain-containing protein [Elusimicrobiota bacterium]
MRRSLVFALLACLLRPASAQAPKTLKDYDARFDQGLYQEALKGYESLLKSPDEETRLRALYRAVESEALLFRYAEAAARSLAAKLPEDPVWRGRFLIQRAELAREFIKQYGYSAPADVEAGTKDLARRTPEEWHKEAQAAFLQLWALRRELLQAPISGEGYFVDLKGAETDMAPTLWDFAALRWTVYLLDEAAHKPERNPPALSFLQQDYAVAFSADAPPAAQAAAIMEESARMPAAGRAAAGEQWRIWRLLIPLRHSDAVAPAADYAAAVDSAVAILKGWLESFSAPPAKAQAGWEAASLLDGRSRYADTVQLCRRIEKTWPLSRAGRHCAKLRAEIELPVLNLTARFTPPPGKNAFSLNTRNLGAVFFRLYRLDPRELQSLRPRREQQDWSALRQPERELAASYAVRAPDFAWETAVSTHAAYAYSDTAVSPPALGPGVYLALASGDERFAPKSSLMSAAIVNVTELFLITSVGAQGPERDFIFDPAGPARREAPALHFYTVNALDGRPAAASLEAFRREDWGAAQRLSLAADDSGMAQASATVPLTYATGYNLSFDALAQAGASYAYGANPVYFSHSVPAPIEVRLETDRPIYRPGQEVRAKVTVLRRIPRGYKVYDGASVVSFSARDANYQELYKKDLKLSALGSASARFTIPTGRLLGSYNINASITDFGHGFSGSEGFAVEEYKRPEFEVTVKESTGAWRYGRLAMVAGQAKYYFGGPVPDAPVTYRVYRDAYIPWFCWWWRGNIGGGRTEVASGQVKTGADGAFSFSFTPQPQDQAMKDPWPSDFRVEVESRDAGGRTITAERSFKAGAKAFLFDISPDSGFLTAGKPAAVPVRLMNLNENAVAGSGAFELFRLAGRPKDVETEPYWAGYFPETPSLETIYKDVPNGAKVAGGSLKFLAEKPASAALGSLETGAYRLTVRSQDPWGGANEQSIVLLCADTKGRLPLQLPAVALFEHSSYLPGETARILLGSDYLAGTVFVEIWGGQHLLERRALQGGVRLVSIPLTGDHKGGFSVRWFGARDFRIRSGGAAAAVPWKDRELSLKLDYDKVLKPGQKARWALSVTDRDHKPVSGEAVVRVFDRSLEYYAAAASPWLSSLYGARGGPQAGQGSLFAPSVNQIPVEEGWIKKMLNLYYSAINEPEPPELRLNRTRVYGHRFRAQSKGMMLSEDEGMAAGAAGAAMDRAMPAPAAAAAPMAQEAKSLARNEVAGKKDAAQPAPAPVAVRSDFSETAFFEPQLKITAGRGKFSFKAPEQLTSWKIQASAITKDVKRGAFGAEAVTRKDLMVRVDMPRFYREGDQGEIKAVVHNETEAELAGEVTLSVTEEGDPSAEKLGLADLVKPFTVKPHGLTPLTWTVKAPRGQTSFKIRAVARSGDKADAEERDLPILPSRQRLIETALVSLDGTIKKALKAPHFEDQDDTRVNESMTVQIDPQLALSILNSLPFLVHYPYECSEQLIDRYTPLAITNAFYKKNPKLAAAVKKIPKRGTLTPAWDRSDPRRLMTLMETPWEELSQGVKSYWPLIDMFDPALVAAELGDASSKLRSYQNSDGGYPWFPGGRSDPYITLFVLSGFAEAQRYGVEVPMDAAARALGFVNNEVPKHLKPEPGEVSLILYAAYVVTSYPRSLPQAALGYKFAKVWADYADKHVDAMTHMGKALSAYVYWRLGDKAKGDLYLARAMDGAREDPIAGVYWTPEKLSWLWYNDTVETHAFILRTLLALKPKDPRIPGLVQWLLFNRKGNEWKSTKASAAAIYSLLDVMKSRGSLDRGDSFVVKWGPDVETAQVEPFDWLAKPLRWLRLGSDITSRHGTVRIEKEGPGLAFASLTWIYTTDRPAAASGSGMLELTRRFFLRYKEGETYQLKPLAAGDTVAVGDQVEVQLKVNTRSQFEYVHLQDPKPAGFEAEELRSGWKWDQLSRYEEPRDSLTNFFMDWVPHGEYVLRYRLRPTTPGSYRLGAAVLQSMYAPEMSAHSDSFAIKVRP